MLVVGKKDIKVASLRRTNLIQLTSLDLLENKKQAAYTKLKNRINAVNGGPARLYNALVPGNTFLVVVRSIGFESAGSLAAKVGLNLNGVSTYTISNIRALYPCLLEHKELMWLVDVLSCGVFYAFEFRTLEEYLVAVRLLVAGESSTQRSGVFFEILFVREIHNYLDFRFNTSGGRAMLLRKLYSPLQPKTTILLELIAQVSTVTGSFGTSLESIVEAGARVVSR